MFLILDVADVDKDMALARHVTFVHQNEGLTAKKARTTPLARTISADDSDDEYSIGEDIDKRNNQDMDIEVETKKSVSPTIVREYISRA